MFITPLQLFLYTALLKPLLETITQEKKKKNKPEKSEEQNLVILRSQHETPDKFETSFQKCNSKLIKTTE